MANENYCLRGGTFDFRGGSDCVHGVHTQRCNGKAFSTRFNYTR